MGKRRQGRGDYNGGSTVLQQRPADYMASLASGAARAKIRAKRDQEQFDNERAKERRIGELILIGDWDALRKLARRPRHRRN